VHIHRQRTIYFPSGKEVNSHVSLACKLVISSLVAFFHSEYYITSREVFERYTEGNLVVKLKYVGDK